MTLLLAAWVLTLALAATTLALPTNPDNKTPVNLPINDDVDEFTPYKGERFDDFDWSLLQVRIIINSLLNFAVIKIFL